MKKYTFAGLILLFVLSAYFCIINHESRTELECEFIIDKPYILVVKSLATKNSMEKMIQENEGVITYKNWENFNVEVPKRILRLKEYKLDGKLRFTVEKIDHDLGHIKLPFVQELHLDNHILNIKTGLIASQKQIIVYNKVIEISPLVENETSLQKTHVSIKSELKVKKLIPFFFKDFMNDKVKQTNQKDIDQIKNNIINISNQKSTVTFIRNYN
jgi:hypothetical protein